MPGSMARSPLGCWHEAGGPCGASKTDKGMILGEVLSLGGFVQQLCVCVRVFVVPGTVVPRELFNEGTYFGRFGSRCLTVFLWCYSLCGLSVV